MKKRSSCVRRPALGRLFGLLLCFALLLCAASASAFAEQTAAPEFDFDALLEANLYDNLTQNHKSIEETFVWYKDGEAVDTQTLWFSDDLIYSATPNFYQLDKDAILYDFEEGGSIVATIFLNEEEYQDSLYAFLQIFEGNYDDEKVVSINREDGMLRVVTEDVNPDYIKDIYTNYELEYRDGDTLLSNYLLDEKTLEMQSYSLSALSGGEKILLFDQTLLFDTEFDPADSPFAPVLTAEKTRKVTFIYAPGTDAEIQRTSNIPKSLGMQVFVDGDYVGTWYTDAACTQIYTGSEADDYSDITFYFQAHEAE